MIEYFLIIIFFCILCSYLFCNIIIKYLTKKKLGQIERDLGPKTHRIKNYTPTLGGLGFLLSFSIFLIITKFLFNLEISILVILFPVVTYGLLGLIDDLLILKFKKNDGISSKVKFLIQVLIAVIYFYVLLDNEYTTNLEFLNISFDLKWAYGILMLFMFSGFTNATNLTDGLDGLLCGTSLISLFGFYILCYKDYYEISLVILLIMASLSGFLVLNYPKAKVFMGNIGAYSIGAFLVVISMLLNLEIYLFIFGGVYILETLSVMIQVSYFKISGGKRIFKMAPLHHHFELLGYTEKEVLYFFYIFQILFVYFGIILFKYMGGM